MLRGVDSKLAAFWAYARNNDPARAQDDAVQPYSQLMASSQAMIADDVLDGYSLARHRVLLDIGGGEGVFLTAAGRRHAHLRLMLFDLPAVIARARARFDAAGLSARATLSGGNFFADPIPRGADVIALVRILHDHDDAAVHALLSRVRAALPPGGTVLVAEPLAGTPGARAMGDAYFGIYLAAMGSGRPRTCQELGAMLRNAGFRDPRLRRTRMPLLVQVMTANT
jgi:demethylspheroidene O-methyltransferase